MDNRLLDLISEAHALPVGDHMVRAKLDHLRVHFEDRPNAE